MKTYHLHIRTTITVPEEATEIGRGWLLPDGTAIKPFVVLEKDDADNLTYDQGAALGFFVDDDVIIASSIEEE